MHHQPTPPTPTPPTPTPPTPTPPTPTPSTLPSTAPTAEVGALDHLHPDQLRIGDVGVFAGSWAWTGPDPETMRIPVSYTGRLEDWWNGWAVWSTTRDVIDAMVAEQHRLRRLARQQLVADGHTGADLKPASTSYCRRCTSTAPTWSWTSTPTTRTTRWCGSVPATMDGTSRWAGTGPGSQSNPPAATASSATSRRHQPADRHPGDHPLGAALVARHARANGCAASASYRPAAAAIPGPARERARHTAAPIRAGRDLSRSERDRHRPAVSPPMLFPTSNPRRVLEEDNHAVPTR
jgi:hypothetical protein